MLIEDIYIKSINIKSLLNQIKDVYIVLHVNQLKAVGKVIRLIPTQIYFHLNESFKNLSIRSNYFVSITIYEYENFKALIKIQLPTTNMMQLKSHKIANSNLQLQIIFDFKKGLNHKNQPYSNQQTNKNTSLNHMNKSVKKIQTNPKLFSSFQNSVPTIKQAQLSQNSITFHQNNKPRQTSLQKLVRNGKRNSLFPQNLKGSKKSFELIECIQNRNSLKMKSSTNFFDDYQTIPKLSNQNLQLNKKQSSKKERQNFIKQVNSTTSSSVLKKTLKNAIKTLTQNPIGIQNSKKMSYKNNANNNKFKQFFDYGLVQNKKKQRSKDQKKSISINQEQSIQKFYEKSLSKKQIQNISKLNSFQLSRSIFQQYGLDLTLNKTNLSKSLQKSKDIIKQRRLSKEVKKVKPIMQNNKILNKNKFVLKNQKKNNQNKFQDYGEEVIQKKKISSSKSLRKTQKPKGFK